MSKMGIDKVMKKFADMREQLPKVLANDTVKFFLQGFAKEGFTDTAFKPWAPRKGKQTGRNATRSILVDTGALRRSVSNSAKITTFELIKFSVELPYAEYVNNGTPNMEARQFMGASAELKKKNQKKIKQVIDVIWGE